MSTRWTDASILSQVIGLHYSSPPFSLDATYGGGRMWRGCAYQPTVRLDRRPLPNVDVVATWDHLPGLFGAQPFELVVWDPPHLADGGQGAMRGTWDTAYGVAGDNVRGHASISHLYADFLHAARGALAPAGLLLAKIADQVHQSEQQLQAVDFVVAARAAGWTVCEMLPKMRPAGAMDPKWRRQRHIRKAWSYWIAAHPGPRCTAEGVDLLLQCQACGAYFRAERSHAKTCGGACRERLRYRKNLTFSRSRAQHKSVRFSTA